MVQWLRFYISASGGMNLIPGPGTKIPHAAWCGQRQKTNKQTPKISEGVRCLINGWIFGSGSERETKVLHREANLHLS